MTGMNGDLDLLVEQLQGLLAAAELRVASTEFVLQQEKADVTKLRGMLRAAGALTPVKEEAPKKKKKKPNRSRYSDDTRHKVLLAIRAHTDGGKSAVPGVPGSFSIRDLIETGIDVTEVPIRAVVSDLRDEGVVRLAGKAESDGGRAPDAYALTGEYPER